LPQVTYVKKIVSIDQKKAVVERALEDGYEVIEVALPAVLTAVKELNIPRYPSVAGIVDAFNKEVLVWGIDKLGINPEKVGLKGSPTQVKRTFTPPQKGAGKMLSGTFKEAVQTLAQELREKHVL